MADSTLHYFRSRQQRDFGIAMGVTIDLTSILTLIHFVKACCRQARFFPCYNKNCIMINIYRKIAA